MLHAERLAAGLQALLCSVRAALWTSGFAAQVLWGYNTLLHPDTLLPTVTHHTPYHGDIYRVLSRNACNRGFGMEGFVTRKLKW